VAAGYAQHTSDITSAVNGLQQLTSTLAPSSSANANALTTLSKTVAILAQQSSQFETLLQSIDNLSVQGRGILETYYPQISTQLQTLQAVSLQLSQNQGDLAGILDELPANNSALPSSVRGGFLQLYENVIVCGLPGGGENDSSPAFTCAPNGGGG
jgi:phospholipid/cholesterol/gamma-HCH transport system substrate-binding protein